MIINSIELYNVGPYEEKTVFNTEISKEKNIILIGGKNGAGKTTLFTAIKLCLYGYLAMGYKSPNSYYYNNIKRLINNKAKMTNPAEASVVLKLTIDNRRGQDEYIIQRTWILSETIKENLFVEKNNNKLTDEEKNDFEKFLMTYLPPELFDLYFFDGEKISDFFLNDGSNKRIKNAFLTICGYDTFDIMKNNFKRSSSSNKKNNVDVAKYYSLKDKLNDLINVKESIKNRIQEIDCEIKNDESKLSLLEKQFKKRGGISKEKYSELMFSIKIEEKNRENLNAKIKEMTNDIVPFVMIKNNLSKLKDRIIQEEKYITIRHFNEVLESNFVKRICEKNSELSFVEKLKKASLVELANNDVILNLSASQSSKLNMQLDYFMNIENDFISKIKDEIKKSLDRSSFLRNEIAHYDLSLFDKYNKDKMFILEKIQESEMLKIQNEHSLNDVEQQLEELERTFDKYRITLENSIKEQSKNDISLKSILMLENLEKRLYRKFIYKVEGNLVKTINKLMRKTDFVDYAKIDDDFNISIFKNKVISVKLIIKLLKESSFAELKNRIGQEALNTLFTRYSVSNTEELYYKLFKETEHSVVVPVEIDKDSMSNGEKQIFIMSLYYALVSLSNHEIPFIIDTPFARIDTEHRNNISEHFFNKLKGQLFILSTNEEINDNNFSIIQHKVSKTFMLENADNSKTNVIKNNYFEV